MLVHNASLLYFEQRYFQVFKEPISDVMHCAVCVQIFG